jgi:hypothetical protein
MPIGEDSPLKAHALGDLKRRDDTWLDLLAGFPGSFAHSSIFAAGSRSVLRAPDLFILPAFSSGDFFLTLSHRFLKLSDLFCVTRGPSHHTPWPSAESCVPLQVPHKGLRILFRSDSSSSFRGGRGTGNRKLKPVMTMSANTPLSSADSTCAFASSIPPVRSRSRQACMDPQNRFQPAEGAPIGETRPKSPCFRRSGSG